MQPWEIDPRARELLENACGFALGAEPSGLAMLPSTAEHEIVAGDGMGGCFYRWSSQQRENRIPIVYLSSYGETSRFADDFTDALTVVIAFPWYWGDVLVAAHKSDALVERVIRGNENEPEPDCVEARAELSALLGLDLVAALTKFVTAVRRTPPFAPLLTSRDGLTPASSFAARPYPG
jgi:hypothetical protein